MKINVTLNKLMSFFWNYDMKGKKYNTLEILVGIDLQKKWPHLFLLWLKL